MGSGDWLKNIITLKKVKSDITKKLKGTSAPKKFNGVSIENGSEKGSFKLGNGGSARTYMVRGISSEETAAIRIQTAFRAHKARKTLYRLRGFGRLKAITQGHSINKQASTTLSSLHSWSKMQAEIRARRVSMVVQGRLTQKKIENQLKLDAKLQGLGVEWSAGSETMEEIVARIHHREEASVKRERTLAYAFSHQWRPNSNSGLGNADLGKENWGWSWKERWIAARPWENRVPLHSSPKKGHIRQNSKSARFSITPTTTTKTNLKTISPNGKSPVKPRKLSYEGAAQKGDGKNEEADSKKDVMVT